MISQFLASLRQYSSLQLDYEDWLAAECGSPPPEEWRKQMYFITGERRKTRPESYRDQWDDGDLIIQAHQDFVQYIPELAQVQIIQMMFMVYVASIIPETGCHFPKHSSCPLSRALFLVLPSFPSRELLLPSQIEMTH
ncbi:hypothetical protein P3S67_010305 [Capsicum chacoense]